MTEAPLVVRDLSKSFGGLNVTRSVSLDLKPGEIHALIGPNGAGKSTLINLIAGELRPDSGAIRLNGVDVTGLHSEQRVRSGLARSFQVSSVLKDFTVLENALLAVVGRRQPALNWWRSTLSDTQGVEEAMAALEKVGLARRANAKVATLSYGERRHLELAMALALKPKVLLLDEPMAGVGTEEGHELTELVSNLRTDCAILLVEHDMDVVFALADRVSVLVEGRMIATGAPAEVREMESVQHAYFGTEDVW
ncbi:ABC transporter ATP-binding protein [Jiella avicenniae]|uniref:ABC transporter ATP-binding protein n=1 Tax=Jiella avicenniae TaxID=2907202 RepID=A0A9X1P0Z7_9HYPH|nr:ABC transporter ATP-binding protein [Jiella avicenniae]MCE7029400.1 ABC transporter ATP-binding protein [Jiella avicenniae]